MINCLTFLVAASAMAAEPAAEAPAAFKDIRVHQTGGFAGFDIVYEIDAKGGWHRLSKRPAKDVVKGELGKKDLAKLAAGVKTGDWRAVLCQNGTCLVHLEAAIGEGDPTGDRVGAKGPLIEPLGPV